VSHAAGPPVEQVQALAALVTVKVDVADVQETRLDGRSGGIRAAVLVRGDFLVGTDLGRAQFTAVDPAAKTCVVVLPKPVAASPRLDHDRTRLFAVTESGLWRVTLGDGATHAAVVERAYRDAQRLIATTAEDPAALVRAREQAEKVVAAFLAAAGWHATVRWAD
jgi:hypothetical protein